MTSANVWNHVLSCGGHVYEYMLYADIGAAGKHMDMKKMTYFAT